ncbi:MAG: hypothetical protein HQ518_11380 [Rhodopirellula sp.]|nr:hypothetical protein [Rhodopirellula sp.]
MIVFSLANIASLVAQDTASANVREPEGDSATVSISTHGIRRYRPGRWGTLSIDAVNRGTEATSIESAAWVGESSDDQFGRSVWLPAESQRVTWQPIFIPPKQADAAAPMLYSMGVRKTADGDVFATAKNADRIESRQLILPKGETVFAVINDGVTDQLVRSDFLRVLLGQVQPHSAAFQFDIGQLPVIPEALDAVHVLVVLGDSLARNTAAVEAVQDWTRQGGTLWLLLDTMSIESAQAVCGGDLQIQEVDRVSLTSYQILSTTNAMQRAADAVNLERPVDLVRSFSDSSSVTATVDGWPAATTTVFGQGRVFVSMLSLDGWFVPRQQLLPEQAASLERPFWITTAGQDLMSSIGTSGAESPLDTETMTEYVTSRIGYQLPVRSDGAIVLVLFCIVLIVVCGVVHRLQRPVLLLPAIGILSLVTVGAFLTMATTSRTATESAITFQMVEASGTQDRIEVSGITAFHSRDRNQPVIRSTAGGLLRFDGSVSAGSPVRMLWSDQHVWRLQNATLAAGVRLADWRQSVTIPEPAVVKGSFDESGFHGRLGGEISHNWTDALIADQSGFALPVVIDEGGRLSSGDTGPLPPNQHLAAAILDAEQSRRQAVYRRMFDASRRSRIYPSGPTLLAWSDPLQLQTGRADDAAPAGAMLASFPVIIERPQAETRVRIPSTFLPYRSVRNIKQRIGVASTFSNSRRLWSVNTYSTTSTSLLRFEIPVELLPVVVDAAKLTLKISAPLRDVEVLSGNPDALTSVWSKSSPVGTFDISFPDEASRQVDGDGGFHVALKIGSVQLDELDATELGTQDRNWQVEWMQLEIQGLIQ